MTALRYSISLNNLYRLLLSTFCVCGFVQLMIYYPFGNIKNWNGLENFKNPTPVNPVMSFGHRNFSVLFQNALSSGNVLGTQHGNKVVIPMEGLYVVLTRRRFYERNMRNRHMLNNNVLLHLSETDGQKLISSSAKPNESAPRVGLITARFDGAWRLGNAMFVYATLLGLARKTGLKPVIIRDSKFLLFPVFNISVPVLAEDQENCVDNGTTAQGWLSLYEPCCCCYPLTSNFPKMVNFNENYLLSGYFQSWKYFDHIREHLRSSEFIFNSVILERSTYFRQQVLYAYCPPSIDKKNCLLVGVHIRMSDFMFPANQKYGYVAADRAYFISAMRYMLETFSQKGQGHGLRYFLVFIVVGTDRDWNERNLEHIPELEKEWFGTFSIGFLTTGLDVVDLCILTLTNATILSTGTFGWWAGYLATGPTVYFNNYPRKGSPLDRQTVKKDYYPEEWVGL